MKISIKLLTYETVTAAGYPLIVFLTHKGKPKQQRIGFCRPEHWIESEQIISRKHPDFDILGPIIMDIHNRANKIVLQKFTDLDKALAELFKVDFSEILFLDYAQRLLDDMKLMANKFALTKDVKGQNKILGNIKVYENVIVQFRPFADLVTLASLDYNTLLRFRNYQTGIGNKRSTVHQYLRTLRAIYNQGVLFHKLPNEKPFTGVFKNLGTKSYNTRKKYLDKSGVVFCEQLDSKSEKQKYLHLWLLQFYFGGADLIDIYYLKKKQIHRGRVIFERGKLLEGGRPVNLKIHPKAFEIIKKYPSADEWLFPWGKDRAAYESFRRTYQRGLVYLQEKFKIEVLPDGSNMGSKVARHTFANMAKNLRIEEDMIRELMGHERNEVDNFYKDRFPEAERDAALFEIISSFECVRL